MRRPALTAAKSKEKNKAARLKGAMAGVRGGEGEGGWVTGAPWNCAAFMRTGGCKEDENGVALFGGEGRPWDHMQRMHGDQISQH